MVSLLAQASLPVPLLLNGYGYDALNHNTQRSDEGSQALGLLSAWAQLVQAHQGEPGSWLGGFVHEFADE